MHKFATTETRTLPLIIKDEEYQLGINQIYILDMSHLTQKL